MENERHLIKNIMLIALVVAIGFIIQTHLGIIAHAENLGTITDLKQIGYSSNGIDISFNSTSKTNPDIKYETRYSTDKVNWESSSCYGFEDSIYGLKPATTYYVKVVPYILNDDFQNVYGQESNTIVCLTAPDGKVSKVIQTGYSTTSATLEWPSVSGANSYI